MVKTKKRFLIVTLLSVLSISSVPPRAMAQVLENVEVGDQGNGGVINANFTVPVQYIKHFPSKPTKILQIYLRLTGDAATDNRDFVERRAVRAPPGSTIPLLDVVYKGDGIDGPHLVMRFSRPVSVRVSQGKDNRSVQIAVPGTSPEPAIPSLPKVVQTPTPPEIVPSPVSPRSGEPSAQRKAPKKPPVIIKGENHYAVTLAMSFDSDTDIANVQENLSEFSDYTVYQVTSTLFGVEVYPLRLGFFATPEEAEVIKEKVRAKYPVAWVTLITEDEHKIAIQNKKRKPIQPKIKLAETPTPAPPIPERTKLDKIYPYVINLESTLAPDTPTPKTLPPGLGQYRLYTRTFSKDGKTGQRLRLGFFENKQDAEEIRQRITALYPEAWIDVISPQERHDSANTALVMGDP
ncbi:MAG: SPOR domain-containing protein, partial [Acidiferrobacterales bacterium]